MLAKVLSVYNHYYEIKNFLFEYDFISEEQWKDDDYDLLTWLEGDCDSLKMDGNTIYFGHFHSDYKWDDCFVVITTADWQDEIDAVFEFFNGDEWDMVPNEENFDLDAFLESDPETAKAFLAATAKGYEYAIENPDEAAHMLIMADETGSLVGSEELVVASQKWISKQYIADADSWGVIDPERWNAFYSWLGEEGLTEKIIPEGTGFTNDYLS
jgi:hypothetical protein